ncbi:hypothetical protein A3C86_03165 [Candidatus Kaiserbacteria bacterium RIFCSPHIGHO2_02_FULL_49_16]|uniref:Uncharacterized protein n=1 Tax=Candidatus Kaiserbacteria bacterium RIFCSPHIGHO2_02_FULL_49_16 TaxID=1798490 RepID=A0A1F6DF79_9BACT|nr:MAG: hypothetical protein A3C86_03165 [Candidatus Kaiserbacteria bacterium RIFCSPHIGHO2_02_FULL_49_16]
MQYFMRTRTIGISALAFAAIALPFIAIAQVTVESTLDRVLGILNMAMFLFITIAIVVFFWGLITYLGNIGGEDAAKKGIQLMLWGIIALFVMVSVWGIIRLLQNTFGVGGNQTAIPVSTFNRQGAYGVNPGTTGVIQVSGGISVPF